MRFTLVIGEKSLDFSLGLGFLGEYLEETKLSIEDIGSNLQKNPFKWIPLTMYYSAKYVRERDAKEVDFTLYEIQDLIEDNGGMGSTAVTTFMKKFIESLTKDVPKEDQSGKVAKKK